MNIIDIGAGKYKKYGFWLSQFSNLKIFAFEPHPDNFEKIKNIKKKLNDSASKRLLLFNKAVSLQNGKQTFYLNNDHNSSSLLPFVRENVRKWHYPMGKRIFKTVKTINVETIKLTDVLNKLNLRSIELLNIDTQGDSLDVLQTMNFAQFSGVKKIVVKVHTDIGFDIYHGQCDSYDVVKLLKRRYFQLFDSKDYSKNQEQILTFLNEPMINRKTPLTNFF